LLTRLEFLDGEFSCLAIPADGFVDSPIGSTADEADDFVAVNHPDLALISGTGPDTPIIWIYCRCQQRIEGAVRADRRKAGARREGNILKCLRREKSDGKIASTRKKCHDAIMEPDDMRHERIRRDEGKMSMYHQRLVARSSLWIESWKQRPRTGPRRTADSMSGSSRLDWIGLDWD